MSTFTLRPSRSDDEPFLRALFRSTRTALLEAMPCDDAQRAAICDMQFRAQATSYRAAYPDAQELVVCTLDGEPIGRLMRAVSGGALVLVDIALMPAHRGRGIGTSLVRASQQEAAVRSLPMLLSVETSSPAAALYRRIGFQVVADDGMRLRMRWQEEATFQGGRKTCSPISER